MANKGSSEKSAPIIPMSKTDLVSIIVFGAVIGLTIFGIGALVHRYVFELYLCQDQGGNLCNSAVDYSVIAATFIAGIAALIGLIRLKVYRPLLVLVAVLVSLWGIIQIGWSLNLFTGLLVTTIFYAIAFGLYSWISRIRTFWVAAIAMIVVVAVVRFALAA